MDSENNLIVVFKKEIKEDEAVQILDKSGINYHEGMDSSRGKIYFYNTGPKFILTFESQRKLDKFKSQYRNHREIFEIYIPDWKIRKD